jgi:hypothetical protein
MDQGRINSMRSELWTSPTMNRSVKTSDVRFWRSIPQSTTAAISSRDDPLSTMIVGSFYTIASRPMETTRLMARSENVDFEWRMPSILYCESARRSAADQRDNRLIFRNKTGSVFGAYSHTWTSTSAWAPCPRPYGGQYMAKLKLEATGERSRRPEPGCRRRHW